jgi:GT2 family glycosyltransferase
VTGLVPAFELETPEQQYFDSRISWSKTLSPKTYRHPTDDPAVPRGFPYTVGQFGTGANFAIRRDVLLELGGFDCDLGPGTPALGGEDLDLFVRVVLAGGAFAYEPSAIVWHTHRRDAPGLQRQCYGYGVGLAAYLTKLFLERAHRRDLVAKIAAGARHRGSGKVSARTMRVPLRFRLAEAFGLLVGPFIYLRHRTRAGRPRAVAGASPSGSS